MSSVKVMLSGYAIGICLVPMLGYTIFFPELGDFLLKIGQFILWFCAIIGVITNSISVNGLLSELDSKKLYKIASVIYDKRLNLINKIFSNILFISLFLLCIYNDFYILAPLLLLNKIVAYLAIKTYVDIFLEEVKEEVKEEDETQ